MPAPAVSSTLLPLQVLRTASIGAIAKTLDENHRHDPEWRLLADGAGKVHSWVMFKWRSALMNTKAFQSFNGRRSWPVSDMEGIPGSSLGSLGACE